MKFSHAKRLIVYMAVVMPEFSNIVLTKFFINTDLFEMAAITLTMY